MAIHHRVAVLIDAENVPGDMAESVLREARAYGATVTRRAYGDFAKGRGASWLVVAASHGVDTIQVSSPNKAKNFSDMRMAIDAVELMLANKADVFCLVSSDGDFTPLAIHLRGAGKRVVGIGSKQASASFRQSCDIFVVVEPKAKEPAAVAHIAKQQAKPKVSAPKFEGLLPVVQAAMRTLGDDTDNGWVPLGRLGAALRVVEPDFTAKCRGFGSLKQILLREPALEVGREKDMFVRIKPGIVVLSA